MSVEVRIKAADLLLKRGLRFHIERAPFLARMLRLDRVTIRPLYGGAILKISRLMDAKGIEPFLTPRMAHTQLDVVSELVALAALNVWWKIWLYKPYARLLLLLVPAYALIQIYNEVRRVDEIRDFINITISMNLKAAMMMMPKVEEKGQKRNGG